jgi:excisionase family DNA binding protein
MLAPQGSQRRVGQVRQRHQTVFVALAPADMHLPARAVDIPYLQGQGLPQPQPHGVGSQQEHAVAQVTGRPDQSLDLGDAENIRKLTDPRCLDDLDPLPLALQHVLPEELQTIAVDLDGAPGMRLEELGEVGLQLFRAQSVREAQHTLWQQRQYEALDPANRLVAGELERRWEQALRALNEVESDGEAKAQNRERALSSDEKTRLRQFSEDLSTLWHAPTTRVQDKKRLIRCLLEQVVVRVPEGEAPLEAQVHWVGGELTPIRVRKGRTGVHRYATDPQILDLVRPLAEEFSDEQIARILHRKGIKTRKGLPFNAHRVTNLRSTHKIPGHTRAKLPEEHVYTVEQAAERLSISRNTVVHWIELGLLKGSQITPGALS